MIFPPIPPWDGAHPILVHLPLGALPVAGLLALCAMLSVKSRRAWAGATFLALAFGTLGTVLAAMSGEATEQAVEIPAAADRVFSEHEHLAEFTRNMFLVTSGGYVLVLGCALIWKERFKRGMWIGAHIVFLGLFGYAFLNLANTGHLGGRLVHQYGVRAPIGAEPDAANAPPAADEAKPHKRK